MLLSGSVSRRRVDTNSLYSIAESRLQWRYATKRGSTLGRMKPKRAALERLPNSSHVVATASSFSRATFCCSTAWQPAWGRGGRAGGGRGGGGGIV